MGIMRLIEGIRARKTVSVFPEVMNICLPQGNPIQPVRTVFGKSASDAGRRRFLTELVRTMVLFYFSTAELTSFWILPGAFWKHYFPCPLNIFTIWLSWNRK